MRLTTKPGVSLQRIGSLPSRSASSNAVSTASGRGELRADDLDERQDRRRVEEVHADDALRAARSRCATVRDGERRGVRREHGALPDDLLERAEELLLGVELLDDRLDHEVAAGEVGELGRRRQAGERGVALLGGQPALLDAAAEVVARSARARARRAPRSPRARPSRSPPGRRPARSRHPSCRDRPPPPCARRLRSSCDGDCHLKAQRLVGTAVLAGARRRPEGGDRRDARAHARGRATPRSPGPAGSRRGSSSTASPSTTGSSQTYSLESLRLVSPPAASVKLPPESEAVIASPASASGASDASHGVGGRRSVASAAAGGGGQDDEQQRDDAEHRLQVAGTAGPARRG